MGSDSPLQPPPSIDFVGTSGGTQKMNKSINEPSVALRTRYARRVPKPSWHKRAYQHRLRARKAAPDPRFRSLARLSRARTTLQRHHGCAVSKKLTLAISEMGGSKLFTCGCGWVVRGKASAKDAKQRGTCNEGCWAGKGGSKVADAPKSSPAVGSAMTVNKPTHKQPQRVQQPQPNQPNQQGYTPVFNAWNTTNTADPKDARMEDGADTHGAGGNDGGAPAYGPSEAEQRRSGSAPTRR